MRLRQYIPFITLILCWITSVPIRAETNAVDFIAFETRQEPYICSYPGSMFAVNKSHNSRIFVTIKVESDFPNFGWLDNKNDPIFYPNPTFLGILLHPGEQKRIGCINLDLQTIGSSPVKLGYKYNKVGAYYPRPDLVIPDKGNPEDFVRFYHQKILGFPITVCPLPGLNLDTLEQIVMVNLHPTKTIAVTYTNSTPQRSPERSENMLPFSQRSVGCVNEWPNLNFAKFKFIQ
jgi:hypothetical protein